MSATFADLRPIFDASSIAVIGASADPAKIGGRPLALLRRYGYEGRIFAVNPRYDAIDGVPCFKTVAELPEAVELAVVAVPAAAVLDAIEQCGQKGIKFAVVFGSGFAEADDEGRAMQDAVVEAARRHGIRLAGPNTVGLVSAPRRVIATFAPSLGDSDELAPGDIALVSQSGAISVWFYHWALEQGIGLRHYVAVGNEADLDFSDFAMYMASDPHVKAIGGYIESLKDGRKFMAAAREARARGVPLCLLKVGASEAGQRAAESHTGALAGSDRVYAGVFRQCGVTRADEPQQLIDFLQMASQLRSLPTGTRIGVVSISGGLGAWLADQFAAAGLAFAELAPATEEALGALLPAYASARNPVDLTGAVVTDPGLVRRAVATVVADPGVDAVVVLLAFQEANGPRIAADLVDVAGSAEKLLAVVWRFAPAEAYRVLREGAVPTFADPARGARAVTAAVRAGNALARRGDDRPRPALPALADVSALSLETEHDAKRLLASLGIAVPAGTLARTAAEARAAAALHGKVALKAQAPGVAHKTELGLVALDVDVEDAAATYARLEANAEQAGVALAGVLVEPMSEAGVDAILGVVRDPVFGPVLMLGAGGVLVELAQRVSFRAVPVDVADVDEMIDESGLAELLDGFRGGGPHDRDALIDAALRVSAFADEQQDWLTGLEINPLRVLRRGDGAIALDALVETKRS